MCPEGSVCEQFQDPSVGMLRKYGWSFASCVHHQQVQVRVRTSYIQESTRLSGSDVNDGDNFCTSRQFTAPRIRDDDSARRQVQQSIILNANWINSCVIDSLGGTTAQVRETIAGPTHLKWKKDRTYNDCRPLFVSAGEIGCTNKDIK